jgi:hypothetical protein
MEEVLNVSPKNTSTVLTLNSEHELGYGGGSGDGGGILAYLF